MGLFQKKGPCAVCGGKVSGLFPWKIDGQYVCDNCHGVVDVQNENELTIDRFMEYMTFRKENESLKEQFVTSKKIDFGVLDTKILFDFEHRLFCMSKHLDKTIFQGSELTSFIIKEDNAPLFEASAAGLTRHASTVPDRVMAMVPRITQEVMQLQMQRTMDQLNRQNDPDARPPRRTINVPEPFRKFNVELHFSHPFWTLITCDMTGPTFDNEHPDANDYLNDYRRSVAEIEDLVQALMTVAFPNAKVQESGTASQPSQPPVTDVPAEIRKYMALMEEGVITPGEFEAKKKQLLGI
ncbi:MAG: hypothetical protein PHO41_06800 [Eubacteriales bacterium]|nr:hypothetical protein [Eubacteriales bacterium]